MTDKIEDGGPAFPVDGAAFEYVGVETGMSLRDWFAGQALSGLGSWLHSPSEVSRLAYAQADAMLRARKEGGE